MTTSPSSYGCVGFYVFAMLVLSSPAAVNGRPDLGVSDATCDAADGSHSHCLLQPLQNKKSAQVAVQEDSQQVSSAGSKQTGGGSQASIFALSVAKIDAKNFWMAVAGMLLFTAIVDRLQAYLEYKASASARSQALLARMNSELVMFGIVAVGLFLVTNLVTIDTVLFLQVEYVDILCSLTCIFLMMIVAGYFALFTSASGNWQKYEEATIKDGEVPTGTSMDAATYKVLADQFRQRHQLDDNFVFFVYLKECFMLDCCDVMNVSWKVWVFLMAFSAGFYAIKGSQKSKMTDGEYLMAMLVIKILMFLIFAVVTAIISRPYSALVKAAPEIHSELKRSDSTKLKDIVKDEERSTWLFFTVQMIAVINAFLIMHSLMHEVHVIHSGNVQWYWHFATIPLMLNVMPLLPLCLIRMSFVDAFHNSNHEALDAVITEINRLEGDLRYIKMLWKQKGSPMPKAEKGTYTYEKFKDGLLADELDLHVNEQRAKRLFAALDLDGSGSVNIEEFVEVLTDSVPEHKKSDRAAVFVNIS